MSQHEGLNTKRRGRLGTRRTPPPHDVPGFPDSKTRRVACSGSPEGLAFLSPPRTKEVLMQHPMQRPPASDNEARGVQSPSSALDDAFLPMIARVAAVPIRRDGEKVKGLIRGDGLTAPTLRALAIRWCQAEKQRHRFDAAALCGLELAFKHYSDPELKEVIEDAMIVYGIQIP